MKIDRNSAQGVTGAYRNQASRPAQPTGPAGSTPQADQVTVSTKASRASQVKSQLATVPEVRVELIARLKAQIDEGKYRIESRKLADKLLKARVLEE